MKRYLLPLFIALFSCQVRAEAVDAEHLKLTPVTVNRSDMESIKRGAQFFATNCNSCHALGYLKYNKLVKEAGIVYNRVPPPLPVQPPDLSLEANAHSLDWIYTYLHAFYQDPKSATGVNNLVFPNTSMPNVLAPFQGEQVLVENPYHDIYGNYEWYDAAKLVKQGNMTSEQFDMTIADLVNFLAYVAEPFYDDQHQLGYWVLGYLLILFVMLYYLKKAYWKDVH